MVGANVVSGLAQLTVATLLLTDAAELWHLVVLQLVAGGASAFFFPASAGIVPQTVPATVLQEANALLRLSMSSTRIVGAAAGGLLVARSAPAGRSRSTAPPTSSPRSFSARSDCRAAARMEASNMLAELATAGASSARAPGSGRSWSRSGS